MQNWRHYNVKEEKHWKKQKLADIKQITKNIRQISAKHRKERLMNFARKEMDVRDRFSGIRGLTRGYKPKPYHFHDTKGHSIPFEQQAEHAADTWEKQIRADARSNNTKSKHEQYHTQNITVFVCNKD